MKKEKKHSIGTIGEIVLKKAPIAKIVIEKPKK